VIKVGLLGIGYWGPNLARVLSQYPGCDFTAACDLRAESLERMRQQHPSVKRYLDCDEFLASDVFVEKPLAHTAQLAHQLVALAAAQKRTLFTGHTFIYSPPVVRVKQLIESGELGDLHYISLSRVNLGLYQKDVDVVWDLAVHDISILLYWLGEAPVRGAAFGRSCVQREKRDVAFLWLEFPSGVIASNEVSWLSPQKMRRTCVVGTKRMVVYDDTDPLEKLKIYDRGVEFQQPQTFGEFQLSYRMGDMYAPYLGSAEPLVTEIGHFVTCVETGSRPLTCGDFGAQVVEALELVDRGNLAMQSPEPNQMVAR
jgi:predicted dehydrogenase